MKKFSFFLNCAATALFAIALTACQDVKDNPSVDPSQKALTIQSGDTLAPVYKQLAATTNDIVIEIPAGVDTVYTGKIELTAGQKFTLVGDEKNPPVVVPTASMKFANTFTIKNVIFDCSNFTNHLLMMISTPDEELKINDKDGNFAYYAIKDPVLIENVIAKGLSKAFFYDNNQKYFFDEFTINNCIVGYKNQGNVVINFNASMILNFNFTNSTFFSLNQTDKNFIGLNGSKRPWEVAGYESTPTKFVCKNNTFYNMACKKQFFNTNRLKGQIKYVYYVDNNIFMNTSNKKIYGNMTNNTNNGKIQIQASNNVYLWDGTFFAETNYNGDAGVQLDPQFKNAEEGNFRPTNLEFLNLETIPGDPRWTQWIK